MTDYIKNLMDRLDITEEQATQVIADDKAIDKGEKLFEQTKEQKKASKKYTQSKKAVNAYGKEVKREHKEDNDKKYLIDIIAEKLYQMDIEPTITNTEREINFQYHNRKFRIVLSAPRK